MSEPEGGASALPIVNMHDAKTNLSRLVGREFIIARDGRPVARVTPIVEPGGVSRRGFMPGLVVPDDFDDLATQQIAELFGSTGS